MNRKELFWTVCDILFILILCFVVLFATMMLTKGPGTFTGYVVYWQRLCAVVGALMLYFAYMLHKSLKSLRSLEDETEGLQ